MNFTILIFLSLFCGLIMAEDGVHALGTGTISEKHSCSPDMCELMKEFGIMRQKLGVLETSLKDSDTRLKNSENQILELKNNERPMIVFSAAIGGDGNIGPFNTDTTLVYRAVKTNIGNAYSKITGIFTAPVEGMYYFTFFYHARGAHPAVLILMRNNHGVVMTGDHSTSSDGADNGGNAAFLQLQRGDHVYVRLFADTHVWRNGFITTFSGFLVGHV
ncbi:complement C1q tumor necrosis factor-related protein 3-like [Chaetodon auriga]|uniref:complement C1q tumor necrosis factor-related protein 3-like n=1 Tax=Chaetodon auriga TaxID=39042 RepID=UPI004032F783